MIPNKLKDGTLFVDGESYQGIVTQMTVPELTFKTEEHRGGGMDMPVSIEMGMEALSFSFQLAEYVPALADHLGRTEEAATPLVFRFALEKGASVKPLIVTLRGGLTKTTLGDYKPGDDVQFSFEGMASYYKLEFNGDTIHEIDPENTVRIVNGTDQLADRRAALGL